MIDFEMYAYMEFVFFGFWEQINGLCDEGADGANAPRIFELEPLLISDYALHCTKHASFGAHHENLNEDRPILSAVKV